MSGRTYDTGIWMLPKKLDILNAIQEKKHPLLQLQHFTVISHFQHLPCYTRICTG